MNPGLNLKKSKSTMTPKQAPEPGSPIANLQKAAKRARDEGDLAQADKFEQAARNLGADGDEEALKGVLRKLANPETDSST